MDALDAVEALERLGGIARGSDLLRLTTRRRLRTAVAKDRIRRVGRNRYVVPAADQARRSAAMCNGLATHLSAALIHGWEVRQAPERPQVAVPRGRPLPQLRVAEVVRLPRWAEAEGWATSPVTTVLMCAEDLPFADALAVADAALRHGAVTEETLRSAANRLASRRVRLVVEHADARAANPFESCLRALAIEAGVAAIPQYEVRARGLVLHPDLVDPLAGVVLEADSWEFHGRDRAAFERDVERYTALTSTGWRVLRFTWAEVMHRPAYVRDCIREMYAELAA